jgi:hypothetical protein
MFDFFVLVESFILNDSTFENQFDFVFTFYKLVSFFGGK